jgi:hypothetical protein
MKYGRPTVRWLSPALALFFFIAFAFSTKRAAAQNILPSFYKPGVLVSDASIPSDSTLPLDQPVWPGPCIAVSDATTLGSGTLMRSGVLVSGGPVVVDCVVMIESDAGARGTLYEFSCWSAKPY